MSECTAMPREHDRVANLTLLTKLLAGLLAGPCLLLAACASTDKPEKNGRTADAPPPPSATVLAQARALEEKHGCEKALPAYRVASAMGEGQEAAQYELSACLFDARTPNNTETSLITDEANLWLNRAAFAGEPRAQRALAMRLANPTDPRHDPTMALAWAMIYEDNARNELVATPLPATLVAGLKSDLGPEQRALATTFVDDFTLLELEKYTPPPGQRRQQGRGQFQRPPGGGQGGGQGQRRRPR